jgi:hypothetical protein
VISLLLVIAGCFVLVLSRNAVQPPEDAVDDR